VECAAGDVDGGELVIGDDNTLWIGGLIKTTAYGEAGIVRVAAMSSMMSWRVSRGCPRQLPVMKEKSRCSILFHLEVPGGKWQMINVRPVSSASRWSSVFHSRPRALLLPPLSAVMTRYLAGS
jgi:hypothetical protein